MGQNAGPGYLNYYSRVPRFALNGGMLVFPILSEGVLIYTNIR